MRKNHLRPIVHALSIFVPLCIATNSHAAALLLTSTEECPVGISTALISLSNPQRVFLRYDDVSAEVSVTAQETTDHCEGRTFASAEGAEPKVTLRLSSLCMGRLPAAEAEVVIGGVTTTCTLLSSVDP